MKVSTFFLILAGMMFGIILGQIPELIPTRVSMLLCFAFVVLFIGMIATQIEDDELDKLRKNQR